MKIKIFLILLSCIGTIKFYSQSPEWSWVKAIGGTNENQAKSIVMDEFDNVYTTGFFLGTVDFDPGPGTYNLTAVGSSISPDIYISKLDDSGNFLWAKAMGGTTHGLGLGYATTLDTAGNIYTTGYYGGPVDFDPGTGIFELTAGGIFVVKLDRSGNFVWAKAMGDTSFDEGRSIALDGLGNVYTTGRFNGTADFDPGAGTFNLISASPTYPDIFISKLDASGNFVWAKVIGGSKLDNGNAIAIDAFGNIYTTGRFDGTVDFDPGEGEFNLIDDGSGDTFISKLDNSGNFVWAVSMGVNGSTTEGYSIALDPAGSGDVYITRDGSISKFDFEGNLIWTKGTGGTGDGFLALDPGGSDAIYITGHFYGTSDFDPGAGTFNLTSAGNTDIFISKFDNSGNFLWAKGAGGAVDDYSSSIALNASGNVYIAGYFESPFIQFYTDTLTNADLSGTTPDIFIAKLDVSVPSPVVDINTYQLNIFPNPVTNVLTIEFDEGKSLNVQTTLFNILGEVVLSKKNENITHELTMDISVLATGIYFIELDINGNKVVNKIFKD